MVWNISQFLSLAVSESNNDQSSHTIYMECLAGSQVAIVNIEGGFPFSDPDVYISFSGQLIGLLNETEV